MKLIGISGKTGVGKTTLSLMLLKQFAGYHRAAFGDLLRQEVAARFHVSLETFYGEQDEWIELDEFKARTGMPEAMPASRLLEWYDFDVVRVRNPNHWVMTMEKWLKLCEERHIPGIIIDDVRFPNEGNLIKRRRGLLIRLEPYLDYEPDPAADLRPGEKGLDEYRGFDAVFTPAHGEAGLAQVAERIGQRTF